MNRFFLTALVLSGLANSCGQAPPQRSPESISSIKESPLMESNDWKGPFCAVSAPAHLLITTAQEWKNLWEKIGDAPPVQPDFKESFAVAVFLGMRNTGGFGIKWLEPEASGTTLTIRYQEVKPRGISMQVLTQPYAVKLFQKRSPEIKIILQAQLS